MQPARWLTLYAPIEESSTWRRPRTGPFDFFPPAFTSKNVRGLPSRPKGEVLLNHLPEVVDISCSEPNARGTDIPGIDRLGESVVLIQRLPCHIIHRLFYDQILHGWVRGEKILGWLIKSHPVFWFKVQYFRINQNWSFLISFARASEFIYLFNEY